MKSLVNYEVKLPAHSKGPCQPGDSFQAELKMLSAEEVAEVLGISKRSIWRLSSSGQIPKPSMKIGKIVRWRYADIEAFVNGGAA